MRPAGALRPRANPATNAPTIGANFAAFANSAKAEREDDGGGDERPS